MPIFLKGVQAVISVDTTTQQAIASTTRQIWGQVVITRRSNNSLVDITTACVDVSVTPDYEARSTTASFTLNNTDQQYSPADQSLALNNVSGTYDPLIWPLNYVAIYANVATPSGTTAIQLFQGVLGDQIDTTSIPGQISVQCRDNSKRLQDVYIFLSPYYERMIAEDIIANLLQTYAPWVQFNVPVPSNYLIVTYNQASNTTLWDAIQNIADVMGWRLWFDETGVLQFAAIPVTATPSDVVMDLSTHILSSDKLSFSDANIRNDIWVKAESPYNGDILVANAVNQGSINMFGDRYYEADRDLTAYISTQAQAQQLANAICQRLSFLQSTDAVTLPLWPLLEVGDFVTVDNSFTGMTSNEYIYIVETIQHSLSPTQKETAVTLTSYTDLIKPSGTAPASPSNLTATIVTRNSTVYAGSGLSGGNVVVYSYPELQWAMPSTANLYGYTIYRAVGSSGTFYPADDFRAQNAQGDWTTSWIDYFPVVGTGSYNIVAYDFAGIPSAPSNTISVVTPGPQVKTIVPPSGTTPPPASGTSPPTPGPPSPSTGAALVYSPTETVWVPGTVTINTVPQQVSWANGGTPITVTGNAVGIGDPIYQFWWKNPGGTWSQTGSYESNNVYSFTVNQEGLWEFIMYAEDANNPSATECWSANYYVAGVGSVSASASATSVSVGQQVTITASASNVSSPAYQFWYQMPACAFDPYGNTAGQWFANGGYTPADSFTFYANMPGTYTIRVYCRSTQAPTSENGGQRALYEIQTSLSVTAN